MPDPFGPNTSAATAKERPAPLSRRAGRSHQQREFSLHWMLDFDLPEALSNHAAAGNALPPGADDLRENAESNAPRFRPQGCN